MSYWDFIRNPGAAKRKLKPCSVCGSKKREITWRGERADHWTKDRVWFRVDCLNPDCGATTGDVEGAWSDEEVTKDWNEGRVHGHEKNRRIVKLRTENRRLKAELKKRKPV